MGPVTVKDTTVAQYKVFSNFMVTRNPNPDADRQPVCVTIPVHPRFLQKEADKQIGAENEKLIQNGKKTGIETGIEIRLTDTESSIVEVILKNPQITITDIAVSVGMSRSGAQYAIDNLKKKNVLKHEGSTKRGTWVVAETIKEQING